MAGISLNPAWGCISPRTSTFASVGMLRAEGTADARIRLTGLAEQPGAWGEIHVTPDSALTSLQYCDIGYGGGGLFEDALLLIDSSLVSLGHCRIHHSLSEGIETRNSASPLITHNQIENILFGLRTSNGAGDDGTIRVRETRNNWWDDPNGPTHPSNPDGQGGAGATMCFSIPGWLTSMTRAPTTGCA
jgi:hypothetical protein